MNFRDEIKPLFWMLTVFGAAWYLPVSLPIFHEALLSAFKLAQWYAREHVILCLIPAFFIAGVIAVFISQDAVIRYFGAKTPKWISYSIASVSGTVLAVCSCTILPLFGGIYKRGAGIGPASAFLYSGPAINILAIILTARVLGWQLGLARVIFAVLFSIIIGLLMQFIFKDNPSASKGASMNTGASDPGFSLKKTGLHFFTLVAILVFANWGSVGTDSGIWSWIFLHKWMITSLFGLLLLFTLIRVVELKPLPTLVAAIAVALVALIFRSPLLSVITATFMLSLLLAYGGEKPQEWLSESWGFAKQILPLLALGVLAAGFLLGFQDSSRGLIPSSFISSLVGGNSFIANLFASVAGAFMYFATLTEIPILQGLLNAGMGQGPALALLLAGPALSLPSMLVMRSIMGTRKTVVFVALVICMATLSGSFYGYLVQG